MTTPPDLRQARYERACWWLAHGVELVPLKPLAKQLQPGYGSQKAHLTTAVFAAQWFLHTDANLGIVLGGATGVAVLDWDNRSAYEAWREVGGTMVETLTEQTARGYHAFFIAPGLPSLAGNGYEFKTRGICMVSPSRHPTGVIYQIVSDAALLSLDPDKLPRLFPFLSERLRQHPDHTGQQALVGQAWPVQPTDRPTEPGLIARIKAACSTVAEMKAVGIQLQSGGQQTLVGRCPFHEDHIPSLWVNPQSGLWGCNVPTCPASGIHDVINFRSMIRHISNRAAIKQLADEFLNLNH